MSLLKWYNLPSIFSSYTIVWDVESYMVTTKCNGRSYVIFLLILPLRHLNYVQTGYLKYQIIKYIPCRCLL